MIVYSITNKINGKMYVGQTCRSLKVRWSSHTHSNACRYLHNAIEKYRAENFEIEALVTVQTKEEMDYYEREIIKFLDLRNPEKGYNLTDGGEGTPGRVLSSETKAKISAANSGRKRSLKDVARMSLTHLGKVFPFETRVKMSAAAIGNNRAVGNYNRRGVVLSPETKARMSRAQKARYSNNTIGVEK